MNKPRAGRSAAVRACLVLVAILVAFGGGAVARGKYDARYARNADHVDGLHAVKASASTKARRGKLVATSPKTGRLPDNIVRRVPLAGTAANAGRLGGVSAAALRTLTFPASSAGASGAGAAVLDDEAVLYSSGDGTLAWTAMLPADRRAGRPIVADLVYEEQSDVACAWHVKTGGLLEDDGNFYNSSWSLPGGSDNEGELSLPTGSSRAHRVSLRYHATDRAAGDLVSLSLQRMPGDPGDNCLTVSVRGIRIRY